MQNFVLCLHWTQKRDLRTRQPEDLRGTRISIRTHLVLSRVCNKIHSTKTRSLSWWEHRACAHSISKAHSAESTSMRAFPRKRPLIWLIWDVCMRELDRECVNLLYFLAAFIVLHTSDSIALYKTVDAVAMHSTTAMLAGSISWSNKKQRYGQAAPHLVTEVVLRTTLLHYIGFVDGKIFEPCLVSHYIWTQKKCYNGTVLI